MIKQYKPKDIVPYYPVCLDIETDSNGDVLDIGIAFASDSPKRVYYTTFDNWNEFLTYYIIQLDKGINDPEWYKRHTSIYAHNGARFDWLSLLWELNTATFKYDVKIICSGTIPIGVILTIHGEHIHTIHLLDSIRLMPGSLADITAKMSTTKKVEIEHNKSRMEDFKRDYIDEYYSYLHNDVIGLQQAVYTFWRLIYEIEGSIGYLPMTLPALALKIFRKLLDKPIYTPKDLRVIAFTQRAYTGGRTECYKPGIYNGMFIYDVNSMYPAVMRDTLFPRSYKGYWTKRYHSAYLCAFYEIEYEQTDTSVPPILRDEESNKFAYSGSGVYSREEIELFLRYGTMRLIRGYVFQEVDYLFRDMVDKWYAIRLQAQIDGNDALAYVCKIMLNSLYGKFGQKDIGHSVILATPENVLKYVTEPELKGTAIPYGDYLLVSEKMEVSHQFFAIAALVTSRARILLMEGILEDVENYVYSDTDSIHTKKAREHTSNQLGEYKLELEAEFAVYAGKKLYGLRVGNKEKMKAKGIGREIIRGSFDIKMLIRLVNGESEQIEYGRFPSMREGLVSKPTKRTSGVRTLRKT